MAAIPTKTLAVRLFEYGGPDKLVCGEYDLPPLGPRDVLVRTHAGSVSRWDVKYRAGDLTRYRIPGRAPFPLPQQLGREAAGEVVAAGQAQQQNSSPATASSASPIPRIRIRSRPRAASATCRAISPSRGIRRSAPTRNISCATKRCGCRCRTVSTFEQAGVALWPFSSSHRDRARPAQGAARRQRAGHRRVRRHGPGDPATGEARRRPRHRRPRGTRPRPRPAARARRRRAWSSPPTRAKQPGQVSPTQPAAKASITRWTTPAIPDLLALASQDVMRLGGTHRHHQRAGPAKPLPFRGLRSDPARTKPARHPRRADERHADGA